MEVHFQSWAHYVGASVNSFLPLDRVVTQAAAVTPNMHNALTTQSKTPSSTGILCIWNIIIGLYRVVRECGHSQTPAPKLQKEKCKQDQWPLQSASPPKDEYLVGTQMRRMLIIEDNSSLLTPLTIDEPERKETFQMTERPGSTADTIPEGETLISQVMSLLGATPSENTQIQHRNMPEDFSDILGTRVYQRYMDTPLQTYI